MKTIKGRHGGTLHPPQKGEVRNAKGKPKGTPNTKTRMLKLFSLVVKKQNPITGKDELFTGAEMLDMALFGKALSGDVPAYREIMDRTEGKIKEVVDVTTNQMPPVIKLIRADGITIAEISNSEDEVIKKENVPGT
jgi:hypothetical protein